MEVKHGCDSSQYLKPTTLQEAKSHALKSSVCVERIKDNNIVLIVLTTVYERIQGGCRERLKHTYLVRNMRIRCITVASAPY